MAWAAGADRSHRRLIGIRFEPGNELVEIIRRHSFVGQQQQWSIGEQRDGGEILHEVVLQCIGSAVRDVGVPYANNQSISVGRRACDPAGTDAAGRATDILYHDGLTKRGPHALGEEARDHVCQPAWGEWHDYRDGARRVVLGTRQQGPGKRRAAGKRDELATPHHSLTSSSATFRVSGTVSPSALAVLRFIMSSNLVGCMTGKSAGFSPLRIRPV